MSQFKKYAFSFTFYVLLCLNLVAATTSKELAEYPDELTRDGELLVVGHTPPSYVTTKKLEDGVARLGEHQFFFSTGYGALPGFRSYLAIDLSKNYDSVADFKAGVEIHPLYPAE